MRINRPQAVRAMGARTLIPVLSLAIHADDRAIDHSHALDIEITLNFSVEDRYDADHWWDRMLTLRHACLVYMNLRSNGSPKR
jgi:hypothetical protein